MVLRLFLHSGHMAGSVVGTEGMHRERMECRVPTFLASTHSTLPYLSFFIHHVAVHPDAVRPIGAIS